jgi:hypothetical protein
MLGWIFGKRFKQIEEDTKKGFTSVKEDMDAVGRWIKHLDKRDKHLFETLESLRNEISTVKGDLADLRANAAGAVEAEENKQLFKKVAVLNKQTAVEAVEEPVQTPVQTGNFYGIFKNLSANERLVLFTLMNAENGMKLSYEDLALLLGKERSTIRGQINAIKQKSEGLIEEITEKTGKKRVYVPDEIREKLAKYAKVRVRKGRKAEVL